MYRKLFVPLWSSASVPGKGLQSDVVAHSNNTFHVKLFVDFTSSVSDFSFATHIHCKSKIQVCYTYVEFRIYV